MTPPLVDSFLDVFFAGADRVSFSHALSGASGAGVGLNLRHGIGHYMYTVL